MATVFGLSSIIKFLDKVCRLIGKFSSDIRAHVPDEDKADYDQAIAAIMAACVVIKAIDYLGDLSHPDA